MIQVNELRIGNWVLAKEDTGLREQPWVRTKVKLMTESSINNWSGMGDSGFTGPEDMKGIPLTEEILLKCGFIKDKGRSQDNHWSKGKNGYLPEIYDLANVEIGFMEEENEFKVVCTHPYEYDDTGRLWDHKDISNPVLFLHQLQNLYFALTGKELEVAL